MISTLASVAPFILLLTLIAVGPIAWPHWWASNRRKSICIACVALPVLAWLGWQAPAALVHSLEEYIAFITLLGALFVVAGGIAISGDLRATPHMNTTFLAIGALLANIIGTTGASMVLIRPLLQTNAERRRVRHLPIFFIFIVSNCGGLLTPLGDPPLFLGYLRGVPFAWTLQLWPIWLTMNGLLLVIFYCWDRWAYRHETEYQLRLDRTRIKPLQFHGLVNIVFLCGVIGAVFLPFLWRCLVMSAMAAASWRFGPRSARTINRYSWHPIAEVAILFAGIFITMVPALDWLQREASAFGLAQPWHYFWCTGLFSSVLDNAPTYLTFFTLAQGMGFSPDLVGMPAPILAAISVGAVFMGANTYIGNGPNFMVKAIADHARFHTPSFVGYIGYSLAVLFPLYGLVHWIFF